MRAFVTGGTGFIGSHVARTLRGRGDEAAALLRSPKKAPCELGYEARDLDTGLRQTLGVDS
jgi:nucleoside-diphosphate-sugar epimerase